MKFAPGVKQLVDLALAEDLTGGDITSQATVPAELLAHAKVRAKAPGVIAGLAVAQLVCQQVDPALEWTPLVADGDSVAPSTVIATLDGPARAILMAERTLLNFLQRLSGVATLTARYVALIEGTGARLVDTRKTTPGWRVIEKAAVCAGGGTNHRLSLSDGVLIKDNHLALGGMDIAGAVRQARANAPHTVRIEVEVEDLDGVQQALEAGADIIMLDNMGLEDMRSAVERIGGRAIVEASGGITLERIRAVAETGVDLISCGAITHSAVALDISLDIDVVES